MPDKLLLIDLKS